MEKDVKKETKMTEYPRLLGLFSEDHSLFTSRTAGHAKDCGDVQYLTLTDEKSKDIYSKLMDPGCRTQAWPNGYDYDGIFLIGCNWVGLHQYPQIFIAVPSLGHSVDLIYYREDKYSLELFKALYEPLNASEGQNVSLKCYEIVLNNEEGQIEELKQLRNADKEVFKCLFRVAGDVFSGSCRLRVLARVEDGEVIDILSIRRIGIGAFPDDMGFSREFVNRIKDWLVGYLKICKNKGGNEDEC